MPVRRFCCARRGEPPVVGLQAREAFLTLHTSADKHAPSNPIVATVGLGGNLEFGRAAYLMELPADTPLFVRWRSALLPSNYYAAVVGVNGINLVNREAYVPTLSHENHVALFAQSLVQIDSPITTLDLAVFTQPSDVLPDYPDASNGRGEFGLRQRKWLEARGWVDGYNPEPIAETQLEVVTPERFAELVGPEFQSFTQQL